MFHIAIRLVTVLFVAGCGGGLPDAKAQAARDAEWKEVSGTAIHYFSTATVHSTRPSGDWIVQRSTDLIELSGDLEGTVLYHPVTLINESEGRLVNRGHQVFSGMILGLGPVLLHDDQYRFDVDLASGATTGKVYLFNRISGPLVRCRLDIVGTGFTPEGDGLAEYSGHCRMLNDASSRDGW